MDTINLIIKIMIGLLLIILGGSFAYKCYRATVQGKMTYWTGFALFSIFSPFLVHTKAHEGTLIKDANGFWIHVIMGPVFLVIATLLIAIGTDLVGLKGTDTLNWILARGNTSAPPAIVYNKNGNFAFPAFARAGKTIMGAINSVIIPIAEKDKALKDNEYYH